MNEVSDFFNDHSEQYLEMVFCADYFEALTDPDGYGKNTSDCGDTVEIYLSASQDRIENISFRINGCINTRACANTIARMAKGKTMAEAWTVSPQDIITYLETLPETSHHCAELACGALYRALSDLRKNIRDPWKKNYVFK